MKVLLLSHTPEPEVECVWMARTSRGKPPWASERPSVEEARERLREMLRRGHYSVLEFAYMTLGFEGFTRACLDQMRTHRHLSFMAESTRHVDMSEREVLVWEGLPTELCEEFVDFMRRLYKAAEEGAGRDVARYVLPLGVVVNWVASGNLRAWREFCEKRLRAEAHEEIRSLAAGVVKAGMSIAPVVFEDLAERVKQR
ncbi:MAG: FAD-dependent thymidylate synthase [Candidatus Micrarchaeaceae archaeon]